MIEISLIAAMAKNRVIGEQGGMPWHLPAELKYFMHNTIGKPVLFGRTTYENLPRKPLPKRDNLILTRDMSYQAPGAIVVHSLNEAIEKTDGAPELMIAGGATVYELAMPHAERMYLTLIDADVNGDTYFPSWDESEWETISSEQHPTDENNAYAFTTTILQRK